VYVLEDINLIKRIKGSLTGTINCIKWHKAEIVYSGGKDGKVYLIDVDAGTVMIKAEYKHEVRSIDWLSTDMIIVGCLDGTI
jgi:WD40 repeat protein